MANWRGWSCESEDVRAESAGHIGAAGRALVARRMELAASLAGPLTSVEEQRKWKEGQSK